ncbi:hypothetical protein GGR54DRAFT_640928 [Hypoxylon sp. NC1633]|nr:hypothetical protein GGR54DRAFT_640928 [Hypoxylon sp. NC1633]
MSAGYDEIRSIKVENWYELSTFCDLQHLGPEWDHPLDGGLAAAKPFILNAFHVLSVEASLEHFLNQTLVYCVNVALHSIYRLPITIIPHVPFTAVTLRDNHIRLHENYTPDYTVVKGEIEANPCLLGDHCASLLVGDVKLLGEDMIKDPVNHTTSLSWSALGQLLWYCVSRKTRLGFFISDHELVLMEFVVGREDDVVALGDAVARVEFELSSSPSTLPFRAQPQLKKRKYASSPTTSIISDNDLHKQKRNAPADTTSSGESSPSSPTLPSSVPEQAGPLLTSSPPIRQVWGSEGINPQTPERESQHLESSSPSFVPSSPGEISAETIKDLASTGGKFTVRLHPFSFKNREHWAPALFSFISLAQRVDAKGDKKLTCQPLLSTFGTT